MCSGVGTWLLGRRTAELGARLLDQELATGTTAVERQWALRRSERRGAYEAVVRNPYFRAYLLAGDRQQMGYFATSAEHAGADVVAIVDADRTILASVGPDAAALVRALSTSEHAGTGTLAELDGRVVDAFEIPAGDDARAGALIVANFVDERQLRSYAQPFGVEAAVRFGHAIVSELPDPMQADVTRSFGSARTTAIEIGPAGGRYRVHVASFDRGSLLVGVSVDRIRALTTDVLSLVRALVALIVLVGGIGALFVITRLTNPIARLSRAAEHLGSGDFASSTGAIESLARRRDEIGQLASAFGEAVRNVQELLRARSELDRAKVSLEAEAEARAQADGRAQFFGMLAHELRTPIASIIALNEIALTDYAHALPPEGRATIARAEQSAHRLLHVVNNMLDLAKLQSGRMESAGVRFDLREVVEECAAMTRVLVRDRPIEVHADVSDAVAEVTGDPGKVRQILVNLLGNAAKFVERGEIEVRVWREGSTAKVSVRDTGPGIPAEAQRRIFEAFQQGDQGATRKHSGTGLGLTISMRLAELLRGTIRLESKMGEGSVFTLEFPVTT